MGWEIITLPPRKRKEVEAESIAFIVSHALGVDTGSFSFPYVTTWARGEDPLNMVARSGHRILSAANLMLKELMPEAFVAETAE